MSNQPIDKIKEMLDKELGNTRYIVILSYQDDGKVSTASSSNINLKDDKYLDVRRIIISLVQCFPLMVQRFEPSIGEPQQANIQKIEGGQYG